MAITSSRPALAAEPIRALPALTGLLPHSGNLAAVACGELKRQFRARRWLVHGERQPRLLDEAAGSGAVTASTADLPGVLGQRGASAPAVRLPTTARRQP
jgi:hypothetical protein